jgi:membrane protein YdbS with pleckstrin-like domain
MRVFNPPVNPTQIRTLEDEPWQAVSPRYAVQLRVHLIGFGLFLLAAIWLAVLAEAELRRWAQPLSLLVVIFFLGLIFIWVPRRLRHTRYLLRELDLHLQTGLLWRRSTSVPINRIQHLEITQGPLERSLDLSRLIVYTAGGMKSDLALPGLQSDTARRLKMQILKSAQEEGPLGEYSAAEQPGEPRDE